jgi:flagellar hook-associated protein 2
MSTSSTGTPTSTANVFAPLVFTGVSTFSNDFQTILSHAQQVGQIPIQQLQNQQAQQLAQKQALIALEPYVAAMTGSLNSLGSLATTQALSASSSNSSVVTATDTGATAPASYTISNITTLASAASETSISGYADSTTAPVSSTGTLNLIVGSNTYAINLTSQENNLNGLVSAINNLNAGVTASVITTGNATNPDYLSISATNTGATTLKLMDDPTGTNTNLITGNNQGTNASFTFDGIPVTRSTNTINDLASGVTFNLVGTSTGSATVSLTTDPAQLSGALQNFVSSYNNLVSQIDQQVGPAAGALSGNLIITTLESDMQQLSAYQGAGSIKSLSDLGITFDASGQMSFDQNTFNALSPSQITGAFQFLGSATNGLAGLAQNFTQVSDPVSGMIINAENGIDQTNTDLNNQIQTLTTRLQAQQTAMQQQLAAADTMIASMQSQQQQLTATIQSLDYVLFGAQQQQAGLSGFNGPINASTGAGG